MNSNNIISLLKNTEIIILYIYTYFLQYKYLCINLEKKIINNLRIKYINIYKCKMIYNDIIVMILLLLMILFYMFKILKIVIVAAISKFVLLM